MNHIILLAITNLKRNRYAAFLSLASAILLCVMLNSMNGVALNSTLSKIKIGYIDYDQSKLSLDIKKYLTDHLNYHLIEDNSYEELSTQLIEKKISIIIEVPNGFYESYSHGNKTNLTITSLDDYENAAFVQMYMNSYMSSIDMFSQASSGDPNLFNQLLDENTKEEIDIIQTTAYTIDKKILAWQSDFINSVGTFLMLVFANSVIISFMILDDRLTGVFSRIKVTPVQPVQYIVGTGIFGMILCAIQIIVYCGFIYINQIPIGVPIWTLVVVMTLFSLFIISFSLAVALGFRSKKAITSILTGFSTVGCILGGAFFPIDLSPKSLQTIARVLPQFWFMDTLRKLQADIHTNIVPGIIILALFALLSLLIGAVIFQKHYNNS